MIVGIHGPFGIAVQAPEAMAGIGKATTQSKSKAQIGKEDNAAGRRGWCAEYMQGADGTF